MGSKKNILFFGTLSNGLYKLDVSSSHDNKLVDSEYIDCLSINISLIWHLRLGHVNVSKMRRMVIIDFLPNLQSEFHV